MQIFLIIICLALAFSRLDSQINSQDHIVDISVTMLTSDNLNRLTNISLPFKPEKGKQQFENDWFVIFYSPNCPHCRKALPEWNQFSKSSLSERTASRYKVKIGAVNCLENSALCQEFGVTGLPTFLYLETNYLKHEFAGERTRANFLKYLNQQIFDATKTFLNGQDSVEHFHRFFKHFTKTSVAIIAILLILVCMLLYGILDPFGSPFEDDYKYITKQHYQHQDLIKVK